MSSFYLEMIRLINFRCYQTAEFTFSPHINIIVGNNAVGKTSLVESIYYLALGKSHRTSNERETISNHQDYNVIKATVNYNDTKSNILFTTTKEHKKIKVNNKNYNSLSSYLGNFRVVMFCPEDLDIIKGAPQDKRRFLDINLAQLNEKYLKALISYRKILKQRNEILKNYGLNEKYDLTLLHIVTEELAKVGSGIIGYRKKVIELLNPYLNEKIFNISNTKEKANIEYMPNVDNDSLGLELKNKLKVDIAAKTTTIGPHRDDFIININDKDVSKYGSQGQQRTVALALKLAVAELIKEIDGKLIIILDDVFSELDKERQMKLLAVLNYETQIFITTTSVDLIEIEKFINKKVIVITKDGEQNE